MDTNDLWFSSSKELNKAGDNEPILFDASEF
jgi:hypothetical protein